LFLWEKDNGAFLDRALWVINCAATTN